MAATRLHALDGLRAVAASLVVCHHLSSSGLKASLVGTLLNSATASGVELFFVLSGVVLGPRFIREGRPLVVSDYFWRRAERLWPPYAAGWLLAGITIAATTAWPTWWSESAYLPSFNAADWLGQAFIVNWWTPPYSFAWWSLTVEVSFYIVFPLLVPVFRAIHRQPAFLISTFCGVLLLSAFAYRQVEIPVIRDLVNYASCFAAGMVLASRDVSARDAFIAMLIGACLIIASISLPNLNPHVGFALFYFGIVATASDRCTPLSKRLSSNILVWLGERSYSLFLTHHTIIVLTGWAISLLVDTKGYIYYVTTRFIAAVLSMLVAMILFSLVERRFATNLVTANQFWPPLRNADPVQYTAASG